ncbi:MAG: hypothetical protein J6X60_11730, partial [Ruminiclostridium sp.]|nr:hypothetical protein [Ruminiclostridium sp.]
NPELILSRGGNDYLQSYLIDEAYIENADDYDYKDYDEEKKDMEDGIYGRSEEADKEPENGVVLKSGVFAPDPEKVREAVSGKSEHDKRGKKEKAAKHPREEAKKARAEEKIRQPEKEKAAEEGPDVKKSRLNRDMSMEGTLDGALFAERPAAKPEKPSVRTPAAGPEKPAVSVPEEPGPVFSQEPPKAGNKINLDVPKPVLEIMDILKEHTYTCYLVGECVALLYLGERVMDFDIACSASIDRITAILGEKFKSREELIPRGELIVINGAMGISVAPYRSRIDGSGKPVYGRTIDEDLHRRTFTSETIAYNPETGIYDPFGGLECITAEKTVLRAIDEERYEKLEEQQKNEKKKRGRPEPGKVVIEALRENPECILTAMQKYSRGEAEISAYTLKNINDCPELIDMMLPSEIIRAFRRVLLGRRVTEALLAFREIVFRIFPILRIQDGYDQKSAYQEYTLFEHTARAVGAAYPDYAVRLALLFHAVGKPDCAADRGEYMSFYGQSARGVMLTRDILEEYGYEPELADRVLFMILHHDDRVTPDNAAGYTEVFGMEYTRLLLLFQSANIRAKSEDPVNARVSATLRQLADNITTISRPAPRRNERTATIEGLRSIAERIEKEGI